MYKAIFIDIDGTLRNNKKQITEETKKAIKQITKKGILVVLCSGRPKKYTEDLSRECNASKYIITSGGGNIYDYDSKKDLYNNSMNKKACKELYNIAVDENIRFIMNVGENRVVNRLENNHNGIEKELDVEIDEFLKNNDVIQCILCDKDFYKIKNLREKIEKIPNVEIKNMHKSLLDENFPKEGSIYYDIANKEVSKGDSIVKFCEILGINLADTIAIGDDYNDLTMFDVVGLSVAMGNANNYIKSKAKEIARTNDENGVAMFLNGLI